VYHYKLLFAYQFLPFFFLERLPYFFNFSGAFFICISGVFYHCAGQFITDKDIGEQGAWGMRFGFELSYGELDLSDGSGNLTYTEASWLIGPAYTFENHLRFYGTIKVGYTGFSNGVFGDGQNGYVVAGVFGADYPIMKHFTLGAEAEYGKTFVNAEKYTTTSFGGYLAYRY
jgi:hypothetical protein